MVLITLTDQKMRLFTTAIRCTSRHTDIRQSEIKSEVKSEANRFKVLERIRKQEQETERE